MAKARLNKGILEASGALGKKTRQRTPKFRSDLEFRLDGHFQVIKRKPKQTRRCTPKQQEQRDRWTVFDCIYKKLTYPQRQRVYQWSAWLELIKHQARTPYQNFMSHALQNYMPILLSKFFNVQLSEITYTITAQEVVIEAHIITMGDIDYHESFFERVSRRY